MLREIVILLPFYDSIEQFRTNCEEFKRILIIPKKSSSITMILNKYKRFRSSFSIFAAISSQFLSFRPIPRFQPETICNNSNHIRTTTADCHILLNATGWTMKCHIELILIKFTRLIWCKITKWMVANQHSDDTNEHCSICVREYTYYYVYACTESHRYYSTHTIGRVSTNKKSTKITACREFEVLPWFPN